LAEVAACLVGLAGLMDGFFATGWYIHEYIYIDT
jgi:hypothetical protein